MPVRVYDLSKEIGLSNKEMVEKLQSMGLKVKSASSTIDKITAEAIRNEYGIVSSPAKPAQPSVPETPPSPPAEQPVITPPATDKPTVSEPSPAPLPAPAAKSTEVAPTAPVSPTAPTAHVETPVSAQPKPAAPAHHPVQTKAPPPAPPAVVRLQPVAPVPTFQAPAAPPPVVKAGETLKMKPPVVVKDLAARLGLKPYQLISELMEMNVFATISQTLDEVAAQKACSRHGVTFELEKRDHRAVQAGLVAPPKEEVVKEVKPEDLKFRPPVVTFMGHVDHGKTSLLDYIRKSNVVAREAGGITQHIGAYTVEVANPEKKGEMRRITFLDTPGHEAFTAMRSRGANATDIVVLVVAADDGIMPQTLEALSHARAAKVAIVVAVNKMDLPGANPERVKRQLQENNLPPEEWGGQTIVCEVSATTGKGVDHLLEMIVLQSEILELKANPKGIAKSYVLEAQMSPAGPTVTVLVRSGTLKVGDAVLCEKHFGKIRALTDYQGKRVKTAGPSEAVQVLGLNGLPAPGQELGVVDSLDAARTQAALKSEQDVTERIEAPRHVTLENLFEQMKASSQKELKLVLKADVQGSVEAISESLRKIKSDKIKLDIIHKAAGAITENDVLLASASDAIIIGFQVKVESGVNEKAKHEGVQIRLYSIIYELLDQVELAMQGMLEPEIRETVLGHAQIKQVFEVSKGKVAGCIVTDGRIHRNARARLLRRQQVQVESRLASLKRFQDDAQEVRAGQECGIRLENFSDYQVGDVIECYQVEKVAQKL